MPIDDAKKPFSSNTPSKSSKPGAGILESSSAWLVGLVLSPAEYKQLYMFVAQKRDSSHPFNQQLDQATTKCKRAKICAKALAHVLFPRPDVVFYNNIESDPAKKTLGTLDQRRDSSEFSAAAEIYTKPGQKLKPTIRIHSRLFFKSYILIVLFKSLRQLYSGKRGSLLRSVLVLKDRNGARISLSLTSIALVYKLVYGALVLLKPVLKEFLTTIIHEKSRLSDALYNNAHTLIPLISGITAGSCLKIYPSKNAGRDLVSVYSLVRASEFVYNYLNDNGYLGVLHKPKLIGSWALFPLAYSQLFHAFFFNRDANPPFVNASLFSLSSEFFALPPIGYVRSTKVPWPNPAQIVDAVAEVSHAHYPKFTPALLFPDSAVIPKYLNPVKPIIVRSHPAITSMTGALFHPWEPSQFKALLRIVVKKYTSIGKYVFLFYLVKTFLLKNLITSIEPDTEAHQAKVAAAKEARNNNNNSSNNSKSSPQNVDNGSYPYSNDKKTNSAADQTPPSREQKVLSQLRLLLAACFNAWRTTTFIVMTIVSSWAGIEFWETIVGRSVMPVYRYKVIGFLSGLWALFDKVSGRGRYMYAVRAAILSYWRVLVSEKKVKPIKNGDVYIFSLVLGVAMTLMEVSPSSVSGPAARKVLNWVAEGMFKDPIEKRQRKVLGRLQKK